MSEIEAADTDESVVTIKRKFRYVGLPDLPFEVEAEKNFLVERLLDV